MLRLSVTLLDSFRLFRTQDWLSFEDFRDRVAGVRTPPTPPMVLGRGVHAIAEHPDRHLATASLDQHRAEPAYRYVDPDVGDVLWYDAGSLDRALVGLRGGVAESKVTRVIDTVLGPCTLVGKVDYLRGNIAVELKTKDKAFNPDQYAEALQWRYYLWLCNVSRVIYRLVQLAQRNGVWCVVNADDLPLYRYPAMDAELIAHVNELVQFCVRHGLAEHLVDPAERVAA